MKTLLLLFVMMGSSACTASAWIATGPRPQFVPSPAPVPVYVVSRTTGAPVVTGPSIVSRATKPSFPGKGRKP